MVIGLTYSGMAERFEDFKSAKASLRSRCQRLNEFTVGRNQTGTAGAVEFEEKGGQTITDASLAGATWVAQISAYEEDVTVTCVWENATGDRTTSTVTLGDANENAFDTAITTGYKCISASIDVANPAGVTVKIGVTGMAAPVATIQAEATEAVAADIHGQGDLYVWEETDTAADRGKVVSGEYISNLKTKKYFMGTLDESDSTTLARCYEATYVNGVLTVSTTPVTDFYRRGKWIQFAQVAGKYIALGSEASAIYAIIEEGIDKSLHSRYVCPSDHDAYFIGIEAWAATAACAITLTYTEYGSTVEKTIPLANVPSTGVKIATYPCIKLARESEVKITILGNTSVLTLYSHILELQNPK